MSFNLVPSTFEEAMQFAKIIANTELVPKDFRGKPESVLVAIQMGAELGLKPMQALQNIAVINGRPAIWGDSMLALVKNHPEFEDIDEHYDVQNFAAICTIKRKGQTAQTRTFSIEQAKKAGLLGRSGVWTAYQERMLQMRARGFACRDVFPDALRGLITVEEASDIQPVTEKNMAEAKVVVQPANRVDSVKAKLGILKPGPACVLTTEEVAPSLETKPLNKTDEIKLRINEASAFEDLNQILIQLKELAEEERPEIRKLVNEKRAQLLTAQAQSNIKED